MMITDLIRDYFRQYNKYGWKRFSHNNAGIAIYMIVYLCMQIIIYGSKEEYDAILYLCYMVPGMLPAITMIFHPIRLEKMMYLCPMDAEARKGYAKNLYLFRLALYVCLTLAILLPLTVFVRGNAAVLILILLNNCLLASHVVIETKDVKRAKDERFRYIVTFAAALVDNAVVVFCEDIPITYIIAITILLTVEAPFLPGHIAYIRQEIEEASEFEEREAA